MTTTTPPNPARVLVLDDGPSIRAVLGCHLKRHGCYKPEGFPTLIGFLKQLMGCDQPD